FMMHRVREAMRDGKFPGPMGGEGKIIEADETWIGGKEKNKHVGKRNKKNIGGAGKEAAFALVERGGKVRSFHVPEVSGKGWRARRNHACYDCGWRRRFTRRTRRRSVVTLVPGRTGQS